MVLAPTSVPTLERGPRADLQLPRPLSEPFSGLCGASGFCAPLHQTQEQEHRDTRRNGEAVLRCVVVVVVVFSSAFSRDEVRTVYSVLDTP